MGTHRLCMYLCFAFVYFRLTLILLRHLQDLLFDAASVYDLSRLEIHIVQASHPGADIASPRRLIDGAWVQGGKAQAIAAGAWPADLAQNEGYDLLPRQ